MYKLTIGFCCLLTVGSLTALENHCLYGQPLQGAYCGRGGHPCPSYHYCEISPIDAYAQCCPDYCGKRAVPMLDANRNPVSCGWLGNHCPPDMHCEIAPNDAWAVCCPN